MDVEERILEHYQEAQSVFYKSRIVGIFCVGSQNYGLDTEYSDVDSKLIVLPSVEDMIFNRKPVSATYVRENNEQIDFKDIRLMLEIFRKQNINFIEVLFTKYKILNPKYQCYFEPLIENREMIAHYNICRTVKSMSGQAYNKYKSLEKVTPNQAAAIDKFGYAPKQLCHILRIQEFLTRFLDDELYEDCLMSNQAEYLKQVKLGCYSKEEAIHIADTAINSIETLCDYYTKDFFNVSDTRVDKLLDDVQYDLMYNYIYN